MYSARNVLFVVLSATIFVALEGRRTSGSPKYLFSPETNVVGASSKGTFTSSQLSIEEEISKNRASSVEYNEEGFVGRHERTRRESPPRFPSPKVTASPGLCEGDEFILHYGQNNGEVSAGAIVTLCRGKTKDGRTAPTTVFVSRDHGLKWEDATPKFAVDSGKTLRLKQYYNIPSKPDFIVFTDVTNQKIYYTLDGLKTVNATPLTFKPVDVSVNPRKPSYVMATDGNRIYLSKDSAKTFQLVRHLVKVHAYYWGDEEFMDKNTDVFVEGFAGVETKPQGYKLDCGSPKVCGNPVLLTNGTQLNGDIEDFLVKDEYMFVTKTNPNRAGTIDLYVKYTRNGDFVKANIKTTSPLKEIFVYDISDSLVMLVCNHMKNETNLYISMDKHADTFSLSLARVLYHNPHTEVSAHWLRRAVLYRFVDIHRVDGMSWVYFATQLTVGPVGGRFLISKMTFDKGGLWQRIRGPPTTTAGRSCLYPKCSLHVNLFYGSIYRYSLTTPLLSNKNAPGLIMTTGVLGSNLKIAPNTYVSRDGGKSFSWVLGGKQRFAFADHGGVILAAPFTTTQNVKYSFDFKHFNTFKLHNKDVLVKSILTEPGLKNAIFLVLGRVDGNWTVFQVNATKILRRPCTDKDYTLVNVSDTSNGGCEIRQIQQRNISSVCLAGPEHSNVVKVSFEKCHCRRQDYRCDVGFRPTSIQGCVLMNYTLQSIPALCPEGSMYNRSRGYVIVHGRNCIVDEVARNDFEFFLAPCPSRGVAYEMIPKLDEKYRYFVKLNETLNINLKFTKGYVPHIRTSWTLEGEKVSGEGAKFTNFSRKMTTVGRKSAELQVSNTKVQSGVGFTVMVIEPFDVNKLQILHVPAIPLTGEPVNFLVRLKEFNLELMSILSYKWSIKDSDKNQLVKKSPNSPLFNFTFYKPGTKTITIMLHNPLFKVEKQISLDVTPDIKVKNVALISTDTSITVKWDEVTTKGYYKISNYIVSHTKLGGSPVTAPCNPAPNDPQCEIKNLEPFTMYKIYVVTKLTDGTVGPKSDMKSITTNMAPPGQPSMVNVFMEAADKIVASWKPPTLPNGIITGYKYYFYKSNKKPAKPTTVTDATKTTVVFDNLETNQDYFFEVAAVNAAGVSSYKKSNPVRTGYDVPTLPPSNITVIKISPTIVQLYWSPPKVSKDSNIFFSPKGYKLTLMKEKKNPVPFTALLNEFTFTNLVPFREYNVTIAAFVPKHTGPATSVIFTTDKGTPVAPRGLQAVDVQARKMTITWTMDGDQSLIDKYNVYQMLPVTTKMPLLTVKQPRVVLEGLKPYTNYSFSVAAFSGDKKSPLSQILAQKTLEDKPEAPYYVVVTQEWPVSSSVRVLWRKPINPNGEIVTYKVFWYEQGKVDALKIHHVVDVASVKLSVEINHLRQATKYQFEVVAHTKVGAGPPKIALKTTGYYPYGTEHAIVCFQDDTATKAFKANPKFEAIFIKKVADTAEIMDIKRIADVQINLKENCVEFELIPISHADSRKDIEAELQKRRKLLSAGFVVLGYRTKPGIKISPDSLGIYGTTPSGDGAGTSTPIIAGLAVGAVIIILILVAALVLLWRRYRNKSSYNKFDNQFQYNHEEGTVRSVSSDPGDSEVEMRQPNYRHRNKDIETVPLADADELT